MAQRRTACFNRLADAAVLLAILVALLTAWSPVPPWTSRQIIHVAPDGRDWRGGRSPERALRTLQRAADVAHPGTTVLVAPGVYRGALRIRRGGAADAPITFKAAIPGTVLVTRQAPQRVLNALAWRAEGDGVFSAAVRWPVYHVRVDGEALFFCRWGKPLATLRRYGGRFGAGGIFAWQDGRLHVRLTDGAHPTEHALAFHERVEAPGMWYMARAANVLLAADHIHFEGLRFDFGVGSAIRIQRGVDIVVRDCLFSGADGGVQAAGVPGLSTGLLVEHCLYHNYPQGNWSRTWLTSAEVYAFYSGSSLVRGGDDGTRIRHNVVAHCGDGIGVSTADAPIERGLDVEGNLIAYATDDAFELDGFARHVRVRRNLVYDVHESLSLSPVLAGPVLVEDNLFLNPAGGLNGAQIKLLNPFLKRGPPLDGPTRQVLIRGNVFVGNWLCWHDARPVEEFRVENNVFAVQRRWSDPWPEGVEEHGNLHLALPETAYVNPLHGLAWLRTLAGKAADSATLARAERWSMRRPGPRWLVWAAHPATADLEEPLRRWLAETDE